MANEQTALDACVGIGLDVANLNVDGNWHRCSVTDKKKKNQSGSYCLRELVLRNNERIVVGIAQNWVSGNRCVFDVDDYRESLSEQELKDARQAMQVANKKRLVEQKIISDLAVKKANDIFNALPNAGKSEYLSRKKVRNYGLRFGKGGSVVVPVTNIAGELRGLQFIYADGSKKFLTGTQKKGCFHLLGELVKTDWLVIAEGYATAASIYMVTGLPAVVAFDANNLKPVVLELKKAYPEIKLVIAGDDDVKTKNNPGRTKANEAAALSNGVALFANFGDMQ